MIPFAYTQKGKLVSVQQVAQGLACNCICPACKAPLVARKGSQKVHHFAHYRTPECSGALESSLHHLAKFILSHKRKLVLPPVCIHGSDFPVQYASTFQYASAQVEQFIDGIQPDLILSSIYKKVAVEIAVHHVATPAKVWQLQQSRLAAIEIDVKAIHLELAGQGKGADLIAFTEKITMGIQHKRWLFNPKQHALEYNLRSKADRKSVKQKTYQQQRFYTVSNCPRGIRSYRYSTIGNRTYANVFVDCQSCPHCFEIEYEKKTRRLSPNLYHAQVCILSWESNKIVVFCLKYQARALPSPTLIKRTITFQKCQYSPSLKKKLDFFKTFNIQKR